MLVLLAVLGLRLVPRTLQLVLPFRVVVGLAAFEVVVVVLVRFVGGAALVGFVVGGGWGGESESAQGRDEDEGVLHCEGLGLRMGLKRWM